VSPEPAQLDATLNALRKRLLGELAGGDHWTGELSSSALSTAIAVTALATADRGTHESLIRAGIKWLAQNQNPDGGWPDTPISKSNLPTTLLVWSALAAAGATDRYPNAAEAAEQWLIREAGSLEPRRLAAAVFGCYGRDRTFSVPILTMCALSGRLGPQRKAWRLVPALPFELAAAPHCLLKFLRLPVVSYALPALIAVGLVRHRRRPSRNPLARVLRNITAGKALRKLAAIQPSGGGFLAAAPLTGFVVMCLVAAGHRRDPVVAAGLKFLTDSARADGSWPIDANLATWVTTLSVNALAAGGNIARSLSAAQRDQIRTWLLRQQHRRLHPYTHAAAGGWAWTDLSGGVPDGDDTAAALLALRRLGDVDAETSRAAAAGMRWLLRLQNRDGGMPTFCRGWGRLPVDRSSPDITAHALAAWRAWAGDVPAALAARMARAIAKGQRYLDRVRRSDGSWAPLWFGNENAPARQNLTYGTSRVLALGGPAGGRATKWLIEAQNADGGWGGAPAVASSIEETALAVDALSRLAADRPEDHGRSETVLKAISNGAAYLIDKTDCGRRCRPAPIGLYFARLWYFEKLYPLIFAVSALSRVERMDLFRSQSIAGR